jgi:hypothetical protein
MTRGNKGQRGPRPGQRVSESSISSEVGALASLILIIIVPLTVGLSHFLTLGKDLVWKVIASVIALALVWTIRGRQFLVEAWNRRVDVDRAVDKFNGPATSAWAERAGDSSDIIAGMAVPTPNGGFAFISDDNASEYYYPPGKILSINRSLPYGRIKVITSDARIPEIVICPKPWCAPLWESLGEED